MKRTHWLHEMRWPEIEEHLRNDDVALVPVGATEQHGHHLPLMVDTGWAEAACQEAARIAGAVIAPPVHFGWSPHHMGYPGTITLSADTLRRVAVDVCTSLICHGFHHIVIVNGNRIANLQPLEIAAVELQNSTGARVAVADTGLIARHEIKAMCEADDGGIEHAGEAETSLALHWSGDHVDMNQAHFSTPDGPGTFDYPVELDPALNGNAVSRFVTAAQHGEATAPYGCTSDPTAASAEKGAAMVAAIGTNLAQFIEGFRKQAVDEVAARAPA